MEAPTTVALVAGTLTVFVVWLWKKNSNLPPGPWGLPLLGFFPFLGHRPFERLSKLSSQYGDIYSFRTLSGRLVVVLGSSKVIREALIVRSDEFSGRPLTAHLLSWIGLGFAELEGQEWKEQKRFFLQATKDLGFGKLTMQSRIHEETHRLLATFRKTSGKDFDPMSSASRVAGRIISGILFGQVVDDEHYRSICSGLHKLFVAFVDTRVFLFGPLLRYGSWLYSGAREGAYARREVEKLVSGFIEDHLAIHNDHEPTDFVEAYLAHLKKLDEKGELRGTSFTIDRLKRVLMNMLMEGTESVSTTLCSLLRELALHPEAQVKAQEELDAVVGRENLLSWQDRPRLPYFDALLQELYRTGQVFNISTVYSNYEKTTIRGYTIPKRTVFVTNLWAANNDPRVFPDPSRFDPTRFLGPDGKRIKLDGPFPFGLGKRACVGESLAQMEMFLLLGAIVQNFIILPGGTDVGAIRALPRTD